MELVFWLMIVLSTFSYFIYPFTLKLCFKQNSPKQVKGIPCNGISFIITAHNEEKIIKRKVQNTLDIVPKDINIEIIVASDCSADRTDEIVNTFAEQKVRLVRADQHLGKEYAQHCAIKKARYDLLVFSDVSTELQPGVLQKLIRLFKDESVGAVSSEDRFISRDGKIAGEGAYVKYEMWLRNLESHCKGLVGLSGSFFATRKSICSEWDIHSPSDFNTALNCAKQGKRAISSSEVEGFYPNLKDESKEYQRKLRTAIRGMTGLSRHKDVLNPIKFGLFSYQVWGHKVMRWGVPWFMFGALVSNLFLLSKAFYIFTLLVQISLIAMHFLQRISGITGEQIYFHFRVF